MPQLKRLLQFALAAALGLGWALPAFAQNECQTTAYPNGVPTKGTNGTDLFGINHQNECIDPFTGKMFFPSLNSLVTSVLSPSSMFNTVYAASLPGGSFDAKVNACLKSIQADGVGGVCDATGLNGAQTASADMYAGINGSQPIVLLLDANVTLIVTAGQSPPALTTILGRDVIGSRIRIKMATGNVFTVSGNDFEIGNLSVDLDSSTTRTAGYFIAANSTTGLVRGYVHDLFLTDPYGSFSLVGANGIGARTWRFQNIRYQTSAGKHSAALFKLGGGDGSAVSDVSISNITSTGNLATFDESQMIVDSGIDTLKIQDYNVGFSAGNASTPATILIQNSHPAGSFAPRWVFLTRVSQEAGSVSADCLSISAVTKLSVSDSYFVNCNRGIVIAGGSFIDISNTIVGNNLIGGIVNTVGINPLHLTVSNTTLGANSRTLTNTTDDMIFASSTGSFSLIGNHCDFVPGFVGGNQSRFCINTGTSDLNYTILGNTCNTGNIGTACLSDNGGNAAKVVQDFNDLTNQPAFIVSGHASTKNGTFTFIDLDGNRWDHGPLNANTRWSIRNFTGTGGSFSFNPTTSSEAIFSHALSATRTFTFPDATGTIPITGNGTTPLQTKRVAGCATGAVLGNTCDTTVTWTTAFADANYTATCNGEGVTSGTPEIIGISISAAKTGASITVRTVNNSALAAQFTTIDCTAIHD